MNTDARSVIRAWRRGLVARRLPRALDEACGILAERAARDAPVETGDLRDSVKALPAVVKARRISAAVVVPSDHALSVEYGNFEQPPRPFFRPAIASSLSSMISAVRKGAGV